MKFSEVIKALEDGSKKRYEATYMDKRYELSISDMGYFYCTAFETGSEKKLDEYKPVGGFNGNVSQNLDWQEVKTSVTWQKALEAWSKGRMISLQHIGENRKVSSKVDIFCISAYDLAEGKWYIEEENL